MSNYNQNNDNEFEQFDANDPFEKALNRTSDYNTSSVKKKQEKNLSKQETT